MEKNLVVGIVSSQNSDSLKDWVEKNLESLKQVEIFATKEAWSTFNDCGLSIEKAYNCIDDYGDIELIHDVLEGNIGQLFYFDNLKKALPGLLRAAKYKEVFIGDSDASLNLSSEVDNSFPFNISDSILKEFEKENAALIERFQGGFDSLLGVLVNKMKNYTDLNEDTIKLIVKEKFGRPDEELCDSYKNLADGLLRQLKTTDELNDTVEEYLEKNDDEIIQNLSEDISALDWRCDVELTFKYLKEKFESKREVWEKIKQQRAQSG